MKKIYVKVKAEDKLTARGYILDISNGGMCVALNKRFSAGKEIEIAAEKRILPVLEGRIASVVSARRKLYKYRLGIEFTSREKEKREKVKRFIKKAEQRQIVRLRLI
jgi:c-di-GMP-binding flagellar brake protein YcgR